MQDVKVCYVTGATSQLHRHHIYFGVANRKLSEKFGLWVWLRYDWHNMSDYGVHSDRALDLCLKREGQEKAMEHYGWGVDDFIKIFRRSYL